MLAACSYSWALARKPGGGAGSTISVRVRPTAAMAFTYRLSGRWTKRMCTPGGHLLDGLGLVQVGADPPVLLGRFDDLVVDPP